MKHSDPIFSDLDIYDLWQSTVGIERESIRIKSNLDFANTSHPNAWGSRDFHPYIQTDFAENQVELITPPYNNSNDLYNFVKAVHQVVMLTLDKSDELLWPISTPATIPNIEDIKVAQLSEEKERAYREYLLKVYGHQVQLLSGIHYNFQINPKIMKRLTDHALDPIQTTNHIYMKLGRNYLRYRWLLTYLLGASPFVPDDYVTNLYGKPESLPMKSVRQSRFGYKNKPNIIMRYDSLDHYVDDLEGYVQSKELSLEKELYSDVRFRRSNPARELLYRGIDYIEFRNFDLNPYNPYGITKDDLDFIKLFIITVLMLPDVESNESVQKGHSYQRATAESHPLDTAINSEEARWLLNEMTKVSKIIDSQFDSHLSEIVQSKLFEIKDPSKTLSGKLFTSNQSLSEMNQFCLSLAKQHHDKLLEKPYLLHGFETFEISTQDLIKEAIRLGIQVEIIDAEDNLIKLTYKDHEEIIRKANMTRLDSQISYFIMENKVATKKILDSVGLITPKSETFNHPELAKNYYEQLKNGFVVKPKSTNYGLGISIFKDIPSKEDYEDAIDIAFKEDHTILIEDFIEGSEYRFYVQGDKVIAITERIAAHVIGDGIHTVSQLIDITNQHPLRGPQHMTPLTNIEKGETERIHLSTQGYDFNSIPSKDVIVYLRSNSNVSTGGLPIDRTYEVDSSYKTIAIKAAQSLGAVFCGVDILIKNKNIHADESNYGIIEANFNPASMIHRFPGKGQARFIAYELLKFVFPEYPIHPELEH